MSINVTDLNSLDPTAVEESKALLKELLLEVYPDLDLTDGSILDQLLNEPNSLLDVMNKTEIDNLRQSMSLLAISENPDLADDDIVDSVMSNYQITRRSASEATGTIAIVVSGAFTVIVPATTAFTINGRTFLPDSDYTALPSAAQVTEDNERALESRLDGNYWFSINVTESVSGGASVAQGSAFDVDPEPSGFVEAYAALDFSAGAAEEDNEELISQLDTGIAARAMADRVSIEALLYDNFTRLIDLSIIGFGDNEMLRDAYNIFGISHGGTSDIYARTASGVLTQKIVIGTLPLSVTNAGGSLTVTSDFIIPPTVVPGFYRVSKVTLYDPTSLANSLGFDEIGDRGIYTPTDIEHRPLLNTAADARFTMFQGAARIRVEDGLDAIDTRTRMLEVTSGLDTITVYINGEQTTIPVGTGDAVFDDPLSDRVLTSTVGLNRLLLQGLRFYDVYIEYIPDIADIQAFVNDRERRAPGADYLVKAPIPCNVGVEVVVAYNAATDTPDADELKAQIAADINAVKFEDDSLPAAIVVDAVTKVLGSNGYARLPLTLTGSIQLPDGTTQALSSQSALTIPENDALGVTRRTTAFYSLADDISLTLDAVSKWNV